MKKQNSSIYFATQNSPEVDFPEAFDNYSSNVTFDGQEYNFQVWNLAGREDYSKLRPMSYPGTDVFAICFSLVDQTSLDNVEKIWIREIKENCPDTPYILVGLKSDLRDNFAEKEEEYKSKGWTPISKEQGQKIKEKIGATFYIEATAEKEYNAKQVFDLAIKATLVPKPQAEENYDSNCLLI